MSQANFPIKTKEAQIPEEEMNKITDCPPLPSSSSNLLKKVSNHEQNIASNSGDPIISSVICLEKTSSKHDHQKIATNCEPISSSSLNSTERSLLDEKHCDVSDDELPDAEIEYLMNRLQQTQMVRQNKTFNEFKLRDIERTNTILMDKIVAHSTRRPKFLKEKTYTLREPPAAVMRKKKQEQIDHDNLILLRKIQSVKPYVASKTKKRF